MKSTPSYSVKNIAKITKTKHSVFLSRLEAWCHSVTILITLGLPILQHTSKTLVSSKLSRSITTRISLLRKKTGET